jgi:Protein of unknown function (DUF1559).
MSIPTTPQPPPTPGSGGNPWQSGASATTPPTSGGTVPPPFPPARRSGGGVPAWAWALLGCGGCLFAGIPILAALLLPVFVHAREKARQAACMANLRQQSNALMMYCLDHDGQLPPAAVWMDVSAAYAGGSTAVYRCPEVRKTASFGYAFNEQLSQKPTGKIANAATTPLVYDSYDLSRNAHDDAISMPRAGRHRKGNNVVYADGSVRFAPVPVHPMGAPAPAAAAPPPP